MSKNVFLGLGLAVAGSLPFSYVQAQADAGPIPRVVAVASGSAEKSPPDQKLEKNYSQLIDEFFDFVFETYPSWGTNVGLHQYDHKLEDFSRVSVSKTISRLKDFQVRFKDKSFEQLPAGQRHDVELVSAFINAQLLDYESLRSLENDPDKYSSLIADSVFSLTKRNFAPPQQRLESVVIREEQAPRLLKEARENLIAANVPRIYAEVAIEQLPGSIEMVQTTIPAAFKSVTDEKLLARYKAANDALIKDLKDYQTFIKQEILPRTRAEFAIGRENFVKKLAFDEMEDEDLDKLLAQGYSELHRLQKRFKDTAAKIDPSVSTRECFEEISKHHPKPEQLVKSTAAVLDGLRDFCLEKGIVTIPSKEQVTVDETPSFLRALTFASMDTPGPYETNAREAYYYVTPAEKDWDAKRVEEHMRFYSYPDLINTSVHEAYPGHYVQFLWGKSAPSKVRKLLGCSSNAEGWAHYCEEMMLEEGLGKVTLAGASEEGGKEAGLRLELIQIHDALLRACRYIVGIEMHCKGMSYNDGVEFFMKEGFMEKANAVRETKRGTKDATYMVYTLGKLKILKLRDDYKAMRGDKYSLKDFHDNFLKCGFPPLKIVRAEMMETH
ncbi:MAG: DUF885 domain-containing protein [Cyanobacteria bacterium SZAS TMP-1]|nr:DUF885 domain-containing protein [Cyanobacteria bacterium SZAS TMP-1]